MSTALQELSSYRATIDPAWIDYNGHLRDAYYGLIASLAIDDVMDQLGLDADYRAATQCTLYTLETHLHYLHEVKSSDDLQVTTTILDADVKRMLVGCAFNCSRVTGAVATAEVMLLHVRQGTGPSSAPFPEAVDARLQGLKASPAVFASWGPKSRVLEIKRR